MDNIAAPILEELLLHISTLASIYHKPPAAFVGGLRKRRIEASNALVVRDFNLKPTNDDGILYAIEIHLIQLLLILFSLIKLSSKCE
jgi:hypothetical protein